MQLGALVLPASKSFCWNGLILYRYLLSIQSAQLLWSALFPANSAVVLGAGLEPACLSAYAPQTDVSAIPPPEPLSARGARNLPPDAQPGKSRLANVVLMLVILIKTEIKRERKSMGNSGNDDWIQIGL